MKHKKNYQKSDQKNYELMQPRKVVPSPLTSDLNDNLVDYDCFNSTYSKARNKIKIVLPLFAVALIFWLEQSTVHKRLLTGNYYDATYDGVTPLVKYTADNTNESADNSEDISKQSDITPQQKQESGINNKDTSKQSDITPQQKQEIKTNINKHKEKQSSSVPPQKQQKKESIPKRNETKQSDNTAPQNQTSEKSESKPEQSPVIAPQNQTSEKPFSTIAPQNQTSEKSSSSLLTVMLVLIILLLIAVLVSFILFMEYMKKIKDKLEIINKDIKDIILRKINILDELKKSFSGGLRLQTDEKSERSRNELQTQTAGYETSTGVTTAEKSERLRSELQTQTAGYETSTGIITTSIPTETNKQKITEAQNEIESTQDIIPYIPLKTFDNELDRLCSLFNQHDKENFFRTYPDIELYTAHWPSRDSEQPMFTKKSDKNQAHVYVVRIHDSSCLLPSITQTHRGDYFALCRLDLYYDCEESDLKKTGHYHIIKPAIVSVNLNGLISLQNENFKGRLSVQD